MTCSYCGGGPLRPSRIPHKHCAGSRFDACVACQNLKAIDKKIQDARLELDCLIKEREAMADILNQNHDPFARHLPVELASRILDYCAPLHWYGFSTHSKSLPVRSVLWLSQVCIFWRGVAHHTPSLWTAVLITKPTVMSVRGTAMLNTWLALSRNLPLLIQVDLGHHSSAGYCPDTVQDSITLVGRHARRWNSLFFTGTLSELSLIATSATSFDNLRSIEIDVASWSPALELPVVLNATPSSLVTNISPRLCGLQIDFHNLTQFTMRRGRGRGPSLQVACCVELLQNSSLLRRCIISGTVDTTNHITGPPQSQPVVNSLHELNICGVPRTFWDAFAFPHLTKLEMLAPLREEGWSALTRCLDRSNCHIQELCISGHEPADREVVDLLSMMPELRLLRIEDQLITPTLFSKFRDLVAPSTTERPDSCIFLGQVTSIFCRASSSVVWTAPIQFIDAMTTRQARTLQTCILEFDHITGRWDDRFGESLGTSPEYSKQT